MISTITSLTLLEGLRTNEDAAAWRRFDERYRPLLIDVSLRLGLGRHDADDAAQRTILSFIKAYQKGQYDPDRGRLRSWLLGIAKNEIAEIHAERAPPLSRTT